jgi:hypothetical protein
MALCTMSVVFMLIRNQIWPPQQMTIWEMKIFFSQELGLNPNYTLIIDTIWGRYYTPTHRVGAILQSPCPSVRSHFRNRYLSFYWKKWFYIWYMALAWWLVPCLPFPGLPHIYFLFTVRLTNERVGVFLARRSVQHLVFILL